MILTTELHVCITLWICMGFGGEWSVKVTDELSSLSVPYISNNPRSAGGLPTVLSLMLPSYISVST